MTKITLSLEDRKVTGKKVKQLRKQGIIPANVFGKKIKSTAVQVRATALRPVAEEAGETQIVYVKIGEEKEERPVLITNIQKDPVTEEILHVDFRQVDLKEKITANVPVEIIGESPAVKDFSAALITTLSEIEVEALPADLPESVKVDVSVLKNIGDVIKVADLPIDRTKIEVKDDPETVVVSAAEQQEEIVEAAPAPAEGEAAPTETAEGEIAPKAEEAKSEEKKE